MAVPIWKRKVSSAQFIYEVYTLNIRLGEILMNKPQKYNPPGALPHRARPA